MILFRRDYLNFVNYIRRLIPDIEILLLCTSVPSAKFKPFRLLVLDRILERCRRSINRRVGCSIDSEDTKRRSLLVDYI